MDALKSYDPTTDAHQFKETSSSYQINKPGYLDGMHFFLIFKEILKLLNVLSLRFELILSPISKSKQAIKSINRLELSCKTNAFESS